MSPEVVGTLVFVTQVCHYIDSPVQRWGFAWSAYYIDQETTVQPAAEVGGSAPVSTRVYSSLLLHSKVQVVGLDDRAMSCIGPLKCDPASSAKNLQIKELQLKRCSRIEQECDSLRRTEVQFQTYKMDREELRQALQDEQIWVHKKANGFSV